MDFYSKVSIHENESYYLYTLPALTVLCFIYAIYRKKVISRKLGNPVLIKSLISSYSFYFYLLKFIMPLSVLYLLAFSILSTQFVNNAVKTNGADLVLAIDISNSMLSNDVKPSRLNHSIELAINLVRKSKNVRFGLILFNTNAFLQMPISADTSEALTLLKSIPSLAFPSDGTNTKAALDLGFNLLNTNTHRIKRMILISDGENRDSAFSAGYLNKLTENDISVYAIGVGTVQGGGIPEPQSDAFLQDNDGKPIHTKLNDSFLKDIALNSNGTYYQLNAEKDVPEKILSAIDKSIALDKNNSELKENNQTLIFVILLICLAVLVIEVLIPEGKTI